MATNFSITSILLDNRKVARNNDVLGQGKTSSGIDFKNDTILVSAKNDLADAESAENVKRSAETVLKMDASHNAKDYQNWLTQYQNHIQLSAMAKLASDALAAETNSVMAQLIQSNTQVANLNGQKTQIETNISAKMSEITALKLEKDGQLSRISFGKESAIIAHENKIETIKGQKNTLSGDNTTKRAKIASLRASITEETTAADKTNIENEIAAIEAEIEKNEIAMNDLDKQIKAEEEAKQQSIASFDAQKSQAEEKYNQLITNAEGEAVQLNDECDTVTTELASAVYTQTGLSLRKAMLETKYNEALSYATNEALTLENIEANMELVEAKQIKDDEKLEKAEEETRKAQTITDEKKEIFGETEVTTKAKYELMA